MDSKHADNSPRVGPGDAGESHTPVSTETGDRAMYTGGPKHAMQDDDFGNVFSDNDRHDDLDMMTASEDDERESRAATPAPKRLGRFFHKEPGKGAEHSDSGNSIAALPPMPKTQRDKFLRKRPGTPDDDSAKEGGLTTTKRGRGRPPTTGEYVGVYKAKQKALEVQRQLEKAAAEQESNEEARSILSRRSQSQTRMSECSATSDWSLNYEDMATTSALGAKISENLADISRVAKRSNNLSGPFVKILNDATRSIQEACAALLQHTKSDETRALEAANARLRREISETKAEVAEMRRELASTRLQIEQPQTASFTRELNVEELLQRAVQEAVAVTSARMDARLECLETRLLPEPRLRPPLVADRRNQMETTSVKPVAGPSQKGKKRVELEPVVTTLMPPTNPGPAQKKKRNPRQSAAAVEAASTRRDVAETLAEVEPILTQEWATVVRRKGKTQKNEGKEKSNKASNRTKKRKDRKLRTPSSAAVVLNLQPGAESRGVTYKSVMEEAKRRIDLAALDIPAVKYRLAVTGARIYEISGDDHKQKADALASKLREVLGEENVRISRPQKCAELRITGLDDTANATEIAEAVAKVGKCSVGEVKVGVIRNDRSGRGTAWFKCPVEAAKTVTAPNVKVYVGWNVVRVVLLSERPLRCFRCQEAGHTRTKCTCETDRSGLCFRCGQPDHTSALCENAPHCTLCATSGKPADHRVGSPSCGKPAPKKVSSKKSKSLQTPATTSAAASGAQQAVEMETQQ